MVSDLVDEKDENKFRKLVEQLKDQVELEGKPYEVGSSNDSIQLRMKLELDEGEGLITKHKGLTASEDITIDKVGIEGTGTFENLVDNLRRIRKYNNQWKYHDKWDGDNRSR